MCIGESARKTSNIFRHELSLRNMKKSGNDLEWKKNKNKFFFGYFCDESAWKRIFFYDFHSQNDPWRRSWCALDSINMNWIEDKVSWYQITFHHSASSSISRRYNSIHPKFFKNLMKAAWNEWWKTLLCMYTK